MLSSHQNILQSSDYHHVVDAHSSPKLMTAIRAGKAKGTPSQNSKGQEENKRIYLSPKIEPKFKKGKVFRPGFSNKSSIATHEQREGSGYAEQESPGDDIDDENHLIYAT